jgi:hypothetical protein
MTKQLRTRGRGREERHGSARADAGALRQELSVTGQRRQLRRDTRHAVGSIAPGLVDEP